MKKASYSQISQKRKQSQNIGCSHTSTIYNKMAAKASQKVYMPMQKLFDKCTQKTVYKNNQHYSSGCTERTKSNSRKHFPEKQEFIFGIGEKVNSGDKNIWDSFLKKSSQDGFQTSNSKKLNGFTSFTSSQKQILTSNPKVVSRQQQQNENSKLLNSNEEEQRPSRKRLLCYEPHHDSNNILKPNNLWTNRSHSRKIHIDEFVSDSKNIISQQIPTNYNSEYRKTFQQFPKESYNYREQTMTQNFDSYQLKAMDSKRRQSQNLCSDKSRNLFSSTLQLG